MLTCICGIVAASAIGLQEAPEAAWLRSVPADIPIVVRVRAVEELGDELRAMLKAMSPLASEAADETIANGILAVRDAFGDATARAPFLLLSHLLDPAEPAIPSWSVIVGEEQFDAIFAGLAEDPEVKPTPRGDHLEFAANNDQTCYAARGAGWAAFGSDETMIRAILKPRANLGDTLRPEAVAKLLEGDLAVYVNIPAIQAKYGEVIQQQVRAAMIAEIRADNPGGEGVARTVQSTNTIFAGIDRALRFGGAVVLGCDFDATGLVVSGWSQPKRSTKPNPATKPVLVAGTLIDQLPGDLMGYLFFAPSGASEPEAGGLTGLLKQTGMPGFGPSAKATASAARKKALEGRLVTGFSLMPLRGVSMADPSDPKAAAVASLAASKVGEAIDETEVITDLPAMDREGFHLDHSKTVIGERFAAKIQEEQPNIANMAAIVRRMVPEGATHVYSGTDGKRFLSLMSPSERAAAADVDAITKESGRLGSLAGWKAFRSRFPTEVSSLTAFNTQELVKFFAEAISLMRDPDAEMPPLANLPRDPQFLGFGWISRAEGVDFRIVVPSAAVPVLEQGLGPLLNDAP